MRTDIKNVNVHIKKISLNKLKEFDITLSYFVDYLIEEKLNKIERNQDV